MDEDLSNLVRKISFTIVIIIIFLIPFTYFLINKFGGKDSSIEKVLDKKEDLILLVQDLKCNNCRSIKNELNQNLLSYHVLYTNDKRYEIILKKLEISKRDIEVPTVISVKEGKADAILVNVEEIDDLNTFIEYNNLSNLN